MGNCWARVFRRRRTRRHIVLILIGLDNAGKTKTVNNLAGETDDLVLPTVGFKAVNLAHRDTPVTIYDLGGGPHFRQIWPQYYSEVHGVIFVIDSSDYSRLDECKEVLEEVLSHDKISGKPVLILANKQDKSGALDDIDVVEKLNIEPLVNKYRCPTLVESYTAQQTYTKSRKPKIDPGLRKGYQWLLNYIDRRYGDINLRVQTDIHAELERRKRVMSKLSNRASQTFTAVSDDIATQTGFENPNFEFNKRTIDREQDLENGIILVKPITRNANQNSGDTTITFESVDTDSSNVKPKLSPLFGREQCSGPGHCEAAPVELEPRTEFRKLSPLVRSRNADQHIDFKNRPQSSPSLRRHKKKPPPDPPSNSSSIKEEDQKTDTSECRASDGYRSWDASLATRRLDEQRDVLSERGAKPATCSLGTQSYSLSLQPRPASASLLLRRQLEASTQKRRHSLRFVNRNKTSPERSTMLLYPPVKARRRRDTGDFEHTTAIN